MQTDKFLIQEIRQNHYRTMKEQKYKIKHGIKSDVSKLDSQVLNACEQKEKLNEYENEDLLKSQIGNEFRIKESNSSFNIKDVQGIIYGGQSSRFWVYRKHINFQNKKTF